MQSKNLSIEFWRFFFAFCIAIMHFSELFQIEKYGSVQGALLPGAALGVDFFFILSGFLMILCYERIICAEHAAPSPIQFIAKKISHIYGYYIVAFLLFLLWTVFSLPPVHPVPL